MMQGFLFLRENYTAFLLNVRRQVEQAFTDVSPTVKSCKFGFWRRGTLMLE